MQLFYYEHIAPEFELPKDESRHLIKVLRKTIGDEILFTDGKGGKYFCNIIDDNPKRALLSVGKQEQMEESTPKLILAIAPTKNMDRIEWFLEKSTEIGVDEVYFFIGDHSERRNIKIERLEKIVVSAMKQSLKFHKPILHELVSFDQFLNNEFDGKKYIGHLDPENPKLFKDIYQKGDNIVVCIGPEGDFSPNEIEKAIANNFQMISLGNSRLRTETAGLVACHSFNILNL